MGPRTASRNRLGRGVLKEECVREIETPVREARYSGPPTSTGDAQISVEPTTTPPPDLSEPIYWTGLGTIYDASVETFLASELADSVRGKVQLIFTSPPFPLNEKKKYGNLTGTAYVEWLAGLAKPLGDLLADDGSLVVELGNAWEAGKPVMSTLALEALLALKRAGEFQLCQQFVVHNPARLPSPAQWVNIERIRVKDAYTHVWWMSRSERPKADNRRILVDYSPAMKKLLRTQKYNAGKRPSEHDIGQTSFLTDHGGAIPPNVLRFPASETIESLLTVSNTTSTDAYRRYCKKRDLPIHPARMPPELAEFFIRFLTDEDDLVVDPFGGSNTTGATAEMLRRQWLTVEPECDYIAGSRGRFADGHLQDSTTITYPDEGRIGARGLDA